MVYRTLKQTIGTGEDTIQTFLREKITGQQKLGDIFTKQLVLPREIQMVTTLKMSIKIALQASRSSLLQNI